MCTAYHESIAELSVLCVREVTAEQVVTKLLSFRHLLVCPVCAQQRSPKRVDYEEVSIMLYTCLPHCHML